MTARNAPLRLASLKLFQGLNTIAIKESGDGYIRSHMLEVDGANKAWKYSPPKSAR